MICRGIRLADVLDMKRATGATPLLQWIFQRGDDVVSCHVERSAGDDTFSVCLVPYGDVGRFVTERFDAAIKAFHRHALIASYLRRTGWKLAAYA